MSLKEEILKDLEQEEIKAWDKAKERIGRSLRAVQMLLGGSHLKDAKLLTELEALAEQLESLERTLQR